MPTKHCNFAKITCKANLRRNNNCIFMNDNIRFRWPTRLLSISTRCRFLLKSPFNPICNLKICSADVEEFNQGYQGTKIFVELKNFVLNELEMK